MLSSSLLCRRTSGWLQPHGYVAEGQVRGCVMVIDRKHQIAGCAVAVSSVLSDATRCLQFQLFECLVDGFSMGFDEPLIATYFRHHRNGFWSGNGEIVEIAATALYSSIRSNAVRAVPLPKKVPGAWIQSLPHTFKIRGLDFT